MSLSTVISTNGINLAVLFVELYNSAKIFNHSAVITITVGQAEQLLRKQRMFGKFCGKYMNVDLSTPTINLYWYNRMAGTSAGQAVVRKVAEMRYKQTPPEVLRSLEPRKNPTVHMRSNRTTDFIPNPNNTSKNTSFMYGNPNTSAMNIIHPPRRSRTVNTSTIINPATLPAIVYEKKRVIQVINPRFNPDLYSMESTEMNALLNDTLEEDNQPVETPETQETRENPKTPEIPETSAPVPLEMSTSTNSNNLGNLGNLSINTFNSESVPKQVKRPVIVQKTRETHVPEPLPIHQVVPRDEPIVIPKDGMVVDALVDGDEKDNEPVPFNRFQRANRKKKQPESDK